MTTVAVMQPYFVPYAGYFRLFAIADIFVVLDCVQFARRGWVHRNQLPDRSGSNAWLTLPVAPMPQSGLISALRWQADPATEMKTRLRRFPIFDSVGAEHRAILGSVTDFGGAPLDYLEQSLRAACDALQLVFSPLRASSLDLPDGLSGQDRIMAIVKAVGGKRYVNPLGGRALYDPERFRAAEIDLQFLTPYQGSTASILFRLLSEPAAAVSREIAGNLDTAP